MARLRRTISSLAFISGLATSGAPAAPVQTSERQTVTVCIDPREDFHIITAARVRAERMFETAGVQIAWRGYRCPDRAIRVVLHMKTPRARIPHALAYALRSTQTVTIFYDRMRAAVESWRLERLLAHVLVHEITHILQRHYRHSATGLMKPMWDRQDYRTIEWRELAFTEEDIRLIHDGLDQRAANPRGDD